MSIADGFNLGLGLIAAGVATFIAAMIGATIVLLILKAFD